jgi:hypothetical protein
VTEPTDAQQQLLEELEPVAWAFLDAVHTGSAERVARIVEQCPRMDVVALILAGQVARPPRQRLDGRGQVECGTTEGYREHQRRGEPRCAPCREAHARRNAGYRAKARQDSRAPARAATVAQLNGDRFRPIAPPAHSAYTALRATDRAEDHWVVHAVDPIEELAGTATITAECGRVVANRLGDWTPTDARNCGKCQRLVGDQADQLDTA